MSDRLRWFLPDHPDVLGLLRGQAAVTTRGMTAFAPWSATGAPQTHAPYATRSTKATTSATSFSRRSPPR